MVFIHFQFIAVDKFVLYEVSNQTRIQSPSVPHKICLCVGIERERGDTYTRAQRRDRVFI